MAWWEFCVQAALRTVLSARSTSSSDHLGHVSIVLTHHDSDSDGRLRRSEFQSPGPCRLRPLPLVQGRTQLNLQLLEAGEAIVRPVGPLEPLAPSCQLWEANTSTTTTSQLKPISSNCNLRASSDCTLTPKGLRIIIIIITSHPDHVVTMRWRRKPTAASGCISPQPILLVLQLDWLLPTVAAKLRRQTGDVMLQAEQLLQELTVRPRHQLPPQTHRELWRSDAKPCHS